MHRKNETATHNKSSAQDTINDLFQCKFERKFCIQQTPRFVTLCFLYNYMTAYDLAELGLSKILSLNIITISSISFIKRMPQKNVRLFILIVVSLFV
ncbi:hypothetical protein T12_13564 [Trichinella patagoniensis]|uniref:Uncharacterized protein n=1 Tax=Trichinella patagoniensis TaxID=990121 RepID=A0A0V1A8K2_9BILA|nr:hypothetical protein T12_13564 [Trichinella patagoniensis]